MQVEDSDDRDLATIAYLAGRHDASAHIRTLEAQVAELRGRIGQIEQALMRGDDAEAMARTDLTDYSAALRNKEPQG